MIGFGLALFAALIAEVFVLMLGRDSISVPDAARFGLHGLVIVLAVVVLAVVVAALAVRELRRTPR
ncbi:MAG: hypothetical protein O3A10_01710 [Chloroflexi bacterium]|nr:hypothetical protein [Chloroflexota bacterium]MDA1146849.1 hypothetical protein [Chloroflexota bacterium]